MKKRIFLIYCLAALVLLCAFASGCQKKETTMESILPRANVIKASVSFLNVGVGENIPQLSYEAVSSECTQLCDLLYAAAPVVIEIPDSYSPELNASHEIYLTTSGGTMTLYYDDYQNLINVPINRKVNEQNVRVYLSYQIDGLAELVAEWKDTLPALAPVEPEPELPQEPSTPDDTDLRASIDPSLFEQAATEIAFEPASYVREGTGATFYAYGYHEKSELPQNKVLIVAVPDEAETRQANITSITCSDYYVLVNVSFTVPAEGQTVVDTAVLVERADIDVDKPVIFLDDTRSILYAQNLDIPGEIPETIVPVESEQPTEPSTAAGGEEGDDEPLEA